MPFAKLSRAAIVGEAIAIMYAQGLEGVTLRALAARLDVRAPSLYRHVADKEALYVLMAEEIFRQCLDAVPPHERWQDWLVAFGYVIWHAQNAGAGVLQLVQSHTKANSAVAELREGIVTTLVARGMDRRSAKLASRSVQALATGWTTLSHIPDETAGEAGFAAALEILVEGWSSRQRAS